MKQMITVPALAPMLAMALSLAAATPAQAQTSPGDMTFATNPFAMLIGMLLPAVQKVR